MPLPDLSAEMKEGLVVEQRCLRILVEASSSHFSVSFDCSPLEVTECHLLELQAAWVSVMLRVRLGRGEPLDTLAPVTGNNAFTEYKYK